MANSADSTTDARECVAMGLRGLIHELYFKSSHFYGLSRQYTRQMHDADLAAADDPTTITLGGEDGNGMVTKLLDRVAGLLPQAGTQDGRRDILDRWESAESTINARIKIACCLLGPEGLSEVLTACLPGLGSIPPLRVVSSRRPVGEKRADSRVGQPDLLLRGGTASVSVEMKTRGGYSFARYDAQQHIKYLRLAEELRARAVGRLHTQHFLLAPLGHGTLVARQHHWLRTPLEDGQMLEPNPEGMMACLSHKRRQEVEKLGGAEWISRSLSLLPTHALDMARFLEAARPRPVDSSRRASELARQLILARIWSVPPPRGSLGKPGRTMLARTIRFAVE